MNTLMGSHQGICVRYSKWLSTVENEKVLETGFLAYGNNTAKSKCLQSW